MGVYLSTPVTNKISTDSSGKNYRYGASSMQGWRLTQEDAHNCIPDFDKDNDGSFFAVYDGHGGAEVAQYCAMHFPDFLQTLPQYKNKEFNSALETAFLDFDATLTEERVVRELKTLAGDEENDEDDVEGNEAELLKAEADMPLEELIGKYENVAGIPDRNCKQRGKIQSPLLRAKPPVFPGICNPKFLGNELPSSFGSKETLDCNSNQNSNNSSGSSQASSSAMVMRLEDKLINGHADNENNLNKEREIQDSMNSQQDKMDACDSFAVSDSSSLVSVEESPDCPSKCDSSSQEQVVADSGELAATEVQESASEKSTDGSSTSVKLPKEQQLVSTGSSSSSSAAASSSSSAGGSSQPGSSGFSRSGSSGSSGPTGGDSEDSEDEDSDDDAWEDCEDDDEDEEGEEMEEDEEEEEEDADEDQEGNDCMDMSNEEPGSGSGCTACVALLMGQNLCVANAGDSRCVLSCEGKAVDLSFDHKPEDDPERQRIEKAGGKVTADGRVNGGLNLSRAIGDHIYKRNADLPAREQMITALPDIKTVTLTEKDEFMVLACDGIWNYMSSQEVVDFVKARLNDPEKRQKLSLICEEIFDYCLAPNTYGDGTGCDNMTCIIVTFGVSQDDCAGASGDNKRCANELGTKVDDGQELQLKRPKLDSGTEGAGDATVGESNAGDEGPATD